ncbi:PaaI family thioesterase [Phytohabitans suffuscus]|uniref:Thioesterase domain-containing protein n=1 Tax=Phytohabitans suffuscus TaxID=624315 RepID=A0A6F8YVK9_9ACTN|nr:PaaI family thioesterase [Phytohabitans suffuscus]BCB90033.1 hypothetical protein Psuf_073460 [Phytohabitans suffuscus]
MTGESASEEQATEEQATEEQATEEQATEEQATGAGPAEAGWRLQERVYDESPLHRLLGMSLRVVGPGQTAVSLHARQELGNRNGSVAGGVLTTLIDSAVGQAARSATAANVRTWTQEMKVNFVRRGRVGARLTAHASLEHSGRTSAVGVGRVLDDEGNLLAVGIVTVVLRPETGGGAA